MMGLGFLIMLGILALPILLIAALVAWKLKPNIHRNYPQAPMTSPPRMQTSTNEVCSHCGAGLRPEWGHCPRCGAPAG